MKIFFSKKDLNLGNNSNDKPLYLDVMNNPIDRVTILYYKQNINNINFRVKLTAKYMDTGTYLRPHDMLFCIERTKFPEEQIVAWFKRKVNIYYSSRVILLHENHGIAIAMSSSHAVSMLGLNILQG